MGVFILLTPGFPENENDTTCLPAFQQFALSVKKLIPPSEFIIISFQYPFFRREYYWNGIRVISIGGANKPAPLRLLTWYRAYRSLHKINKAVKIDGLLSLWLTECSLVGKYFARFNNLKHYMWLIGQDAKSSNQYIKRIKPSADNIIAMSCFLKEEYLKNHGQQPFMVAENGINESTFPALNTGERTIDILGVGSLIKLKNYPLFFEIVFEIKKQLPTIQVVIAGTGTEEQVLKHLLKVMQLENTIRLVGSIPHLQILELMATSKVFLHTSNYEGNSTVLMEALYSGCRVFSTRSLSDRTIKNLTVLSQKEDFVKGIVTSLNSLANPERILFNTMDESARKIMNLFT